MNETSQEHEDHYWNVDNFESTLFCAMKTFVEQNRIDDLTFHIEELGYSVHGQIGQELLFHALKHHAMDCAFVLRQYGVKVDDVLSNGSTILQNLISSTEDNYTEEVVFLLTRGAKIPSTTCDVTCNVHSMDFAMYLAQNGSELLFYALKRRDLKCASILLQNGVDINQPLPCGFTILQKLFTTDCYKEIVFLLIHGANIPSTTDEHSVAFILTVASCFLTSTFFVEEWMDKFMTIVLQHLGDCPTDPFCGSILHMCIQVRSVKWSWKVIQQKCHLHYFSPSSETELPTEIADALRICDDSQEQLTKIVFGCGERFTLRNTSTDNMHPIAKEYAEDEYGCTLFACARKQIRSILAFHNCVNLFCLVDQLPIPRKMQKSLLYQ